jgi:hypothetical protein
VAVRDLGGSSLLSAAAFTNGGISSLILSNGVRRPGQLVIGGDRRRSKHRAAWSNDMVKHRLWQSGEGWRGLSLSIRAATNLSAAARRLVNKHHSSGVKWRISVFRAARRQRRSTSIEQWHNPFFHGD